MQVADPRLASGASCGESLTAGLALTRYFKKTIREVKMLKENKKTFVVYTNTNEDLWFWCNPEKDVIAEFDSKMVAMGSQQRAIDYCNPVDCYDCSDNDLKVIRSELCYYCKARATRTGRKVTCGHGQRKII